MILHRRFLMLTIVVAVVGLTLGVAAGYTDIDRLICDGLVLGSVGAVSYSIEALEQAKDRALTPDDQAEAEASLGLVYFAAAQDAASRGLDPTPYWQRAKDHYLAAIDLDVDNAFLYSQIGDIYLALGLNERAAEAYQEALRFEPEAATALYGLSRLAAAAGQQQKAREHLEKVLELAPDHLQAAMLLAEILADSGEVQEAVNVLVSVDRFNPRVPVLHYRLGLYYSRLGEVEKAVHELDRTLQLDPEFAPARELLGKLKE